MPSFENIRIDRKAISCLVLILGGLIGGAYLSSIVSYESLII